MFIIYGITDLAIKDLINLNNLNSHRLLKNFKFNANDFKSSEPLIVSF